MKRSKDKLVIKKIKIFSLIMAFTAICSVPVFAGEVQTDQPLFRFTAMSDLHVDELLNQGSSKNRDQLKAALKSSYDKGYSDLFLCGGDLSTFGVTSEWDNVKSYAEDVGFNQIVWALGNHEYGLIDLLNMANPDADADFIKFTSYEKIYHHEVINGYDFICFGCERIDVGIGELVYSQAQENWIMSEIEDTARNANGKPIFVISHYPISRTRIEASLAKYNNIIFLYGHVHDSSWENCNISKYIDTSNSYVTARMGAVTYDRTNVADALLVDVYEDKVVLTLDRTEGKAVSDNVVTIDLLKPDWNVLQGEDRLYWYLPQRNDVKLCIAAYDENGRMIDTKLVTVSQNMNEQEISDEFTKGASKVKAFFMNSSFVPYSKGDEVI